MMILSAKDEFPFVSETDGRDEVHASVRRIIRVEFCADLSALVVQAPAHVKPGARRRLDTRFDLLQAGRPDCASAPNVRQLLEAEQRAVRKQVAACIDHVLASVGEQQAPVLQLFEAIEKGVDVAYLERRKEGLDVLGSAIERQFDHSGHRMGEDERHQADGHCRRTAAQVPVQAAELVVAQRTRDPSAPRKCRAGRRLKTVALALLVTTSALAPARFAAGADAAPLVEHDAGRLSVEAVDVPLATLMQAVGEQTGIQVRISPDLDHTVSTAFEDVPLLEALRRMLRGLVWVMIYDSQGAEGAPSKPPEVVIYGLIGQPRPPFLVSADKVSPAANGSARSGPDTETVAREVAKLESAGAADRLRVVANLAKLEHPTAIAALARLLEEDDDFDVRLSALQALRGREDSSVIAAIERGLGDEDPSIRLLALDALVERGLEAAMPSLGSVLFGDSDSEMRLIAVQYLAAMPGEASTALLEAAALDSDAIVRSAAAEALGRRRPGAAAR